MCGPQSVVGVEIRPNLAEGCCTSTCRRHGWNIPDASRCHRHAGITVFRGLLFGLQHQRDGGIKAAQGKQSQSLSYNGLRVPTGASASAGRLSGEPELFFRQWAGDGQPVYLGTVSTCTVPSRAGAQISYWVRTTSILRFSAPALYRCQSGK